ncbi:lateral eye opsin [Nephila pilipes]|uniref:Lateral eye opsin n=1 Tax=Nephila pilipes TaxID=299642 RepID=A0A8X6Q2L6_NEPPI|nr:lateral eye opsin [Nephila pilipes]
MDSDCSDEDMSSSVNEVSAILSRIRDFDVSNVDNEIDNLIHFDKCLEISENLDKFIEDINQFNLTNVDYLNKKALILELALKCSKRLNVLNHHELQQHLNHELHLLKERLTAIENKLITAAEIQPINPTPKTNKIKRNQISPLKQQGKKSKINESIITPAPLELKNKFMSLEVEEFPSLTNNNEDVSQTMESNSNQETNSDNEEEIEPLTAEINKKRIPPIIIDESVNTPALMDEICTLLGFKIMARMVALMTVILWFIAWTPYLMLALGGVITDRKYITPLTTIWGSVFAKASSCYNPIVYGISHPKYKAALHQKFKCLFCKADAGSKNDASTVVSDLDKTTSA